jgi:hypothetical protein
VTVRSLNVYTLTITAFKLRKFTFNLHNWKVHGCQQAVHPQGHILHLWSPCQLLTGNIYKAVSWLRWSVTGLSARRPVFNTRPVLVRFVFDKLALRQGFLQVLAFSLSVSFLQCSYSYSSSCCSYEKDKRRRPGNLTESNAVSVVREHWIENCFHLMYAYIQSVL